MKITNLVVENYLNCKLKAQLTLSGQLGIKHEYELLVTELKHEYQLRATSALLHRLKLETAPTIPFVRIDDLKLGNQLILDCVVEHGQYRFHFDALRRIPGESSLGDFHYVPAHFHHDEKIREEQKLHLATMAHLLGLVQQRKPDIGICIVGSACKLIKVKLAYRQEKVHELLDALEGIRIGTVDANLRLNRHCQVCEFHDRCKMEAKQKGDLSLLHGLSDAELEKYKATGVFTLKQLSYTFRPRRKRKSQHTRMGKRAYPLQALAIRENRVFVLGSPQLPQAPSHVYLDIEGDQTGRHPYLFGCTISSNSQQRHLSFWSDDADSEADLLAPFFAEIESLNEFIVFHYGSYELDCFKALRNAENAVLIDRIIAHSCNILSLVYNHVYFPTYPNSLKDIGGFLGCKWTTQITSGSQSLFWRRKWETGRSEARKQALIIYNQEDCKALQRVTQFLYGMIVHQGNENDASANASDPPVTSADAIGLKSNWNDRSPLFPDFDYINKCGYFDYQRERVFVRHNKGIRKQQTKKKKRQRARIRANRQVEIDVSECPECGGHRFSRTERRRAKWAFDLIVSAVGIKRHVTKCTAAKHVCQRCGLTFVPEEYKQLDKHGHALKSWAMYQHVEHRMSTHILEEMFRDIFGLPVYGAEFIDFKELLADRYRETYKRILARLRSGTLIHADETPVTTKTGKGYVWVLASLEDVVYMYRPNREGTFLPDLFEGFNGVLVSDFYNAYDALPCPQQKCLVHFIRDLNNDLIKNPFDEELKRFVSNFSSLMKSIVATIDKSGLREQVLRKHRRAAESFVRETVEGQFQSKVMESYRKRIERYGSRMFTFLKYDGVPWNNAHAEHAIRRFAYYRDKSSGLMTVPGLETYLLLLSIAQTCNYQGIRFLEFLLSQEISIDEFSQNKRRKRIPPTLNRYPVGFRPLNRTAEKDRKTQKRVYDKRIRIAYLKKAGKTVPEIQEELGVSRLQIVRTLEKTHRSRGRRKAD